VDKSELIRVVEALRESEERLRAIGDNLPLGAVYQLVGYPDGRRQFTYISSGVEPLLGVTPAEVRANALALYGLVHEADRDRVQAEEEVAGRTLAPFDCELRSWTRAGKLVWLHARSAPRRVSTGETVWEGIVIDVSARKLAEEALDRERELLGTIIERIPVMLTLYEPDTKVLRLNPAFEQATGWSNADAVGVSLMEACYPDPAYRERVRKFMQSCREGWMDIRMRTRDGRDLETSWANVRLSDGTQVGIGLDIADRKRYEQTLRDADRRKDEFLATLAHELRNPLAPIRNGLEIMKLAQADAGAASPVVAKARGMMERQLAQLVRIVDDLLDVSRITLGKLELRKEWVALASVIHSAVEISQPLIDASGHRLTVTLPPEPVVLHADPTRLAQVFANLLTNAAKYTNRGGHIGLTAERRGGEVVASVLDTGIGIAAEHLPALFHMFSQLPNSPERAHGGLGIGLTLVKQLTEMHGGWVEARSNGPGQGSEFIVRLPVAVNAGGPLQPAVAPAPVPATAPRRILIVDDSRDGADSLAIMLRGMGHDIRTAYDGHEALDAVAAFHPAVILLDLGLPKLNGLEVCRRLRQQPGGDQLVIIAQTGWGRDEDRHQTREAGFDHHLVKPVDPGVLTQLLAGAV
jgi:PAS domain S-box-containing protein